MMLLPNFTIAFYMLCPQPTVCAAKACKKARVKLDNNIMKMLLSKSNWVRVFLPLWMAIPLVTCALAC